MYCTFISLCVASAKMKRRIGDAQFNSVLQSCRSTQQQQQSKTCPNPNSNNASVSSVRSHSQSLCTASDTLD